MVGQIVRAVGELFEKYILWPSGMPSEWVLRPDAAKAGLLNPEQLTALIARVNQSGFDFAKMKLKSADDPERDAKLGQWQAVTRRINIDVGGKNPRIGVFNRSYGLMVGLTVAVLAITLALVMKGVFAANWALTINPTSVAFAEAGAAIILAVCCAYRTRQFGKGYARELFVTYVEGSSGKKKRRPPRGGAKKGGKTRKKRR